MTAVRDPRTGRYRQPRRDWPTCPDCGSILHTRLAGDVVCLATWCERAKVAGVGA